MRIPLLAACALVVGSGPAHAKKMVDPLTGALMNLATAAKCDDAASPWRPWCIAATGWRDGTAGDLPVGKVLVGMTIELANGSDLEQALHDSVSLTAFAVAKDGKVKVTNVKPTNEKEVQSAGAAIFELVAVFKDKQKIAKLPKDVASYLGGLKGAHPTTKGTNEWTWKGASSGRARKVGRWWVAVETPGEQNGFFVTILTDAWASE